MRFLQSIRFRIISICILFALVVNLSYTQLLVLVTEESQDDIFNLHIVQRARDWSEAYSKDVTVLKNSNITKENIFIGSDAELIEYVSKKYSLDKNGLGKEFESLAQWPLVGHIESEFHDDVILYEIEYRSTLLLHIAKSPLYQNKELKSLYYLVDITELYPEAFSEADTTLMQLFVLLITTICSVLIGFYLANRAVLPLSQLSNDVIAVEVGNKIELSRQYYNDEVGLLADNLSTIFRRIESFIEREKSFSRDASHELRTPITNIQIAIELARSMPQFDDEKVQSILNRISRSNKDMIHLVETFLLLGREESKEEASVLCDFHDMIEECLEKNKYLIGSEQLSINNNVLANTRVIQPVNILAIVLNNLIRNSFQYTQTGSVTVSGSESYLEVKDTGIGFAYSEDIAPYANQHESGLGLGLNIVQKICFIRGWNFQIHSEVGKGTNIRINF